MITRTVTGLLFGLVSAFAQADETQTLGTRVISETETAVGLLIAPWREEAASTTDRPPRLFDVPFAPVDPDAFRHASELQESLATARRARIH